MRVLVAPDSFKESASASEVAESIGEGLRRAWPAADIDLAPMADGGEGTMDVLVTATGGHYITCAAHDPLGREIKARYGVLGDGKTAIAEMAAASGLPLLPAAERNPGVTSTYGTGELIRHALGNGLHHVIVGMGGSATNDGGTGAAQALGWKFMDADNERLPSGGLALKNLFTLDSSEVEPLLNASRIEAAYDVDVPLFGPTSTSMMFAAQKGADEAMCNALDAALRHFAEQVRTQLQIDVQTIAGAGAAGGLGAGLAAFCGAKLIPGVNLVARTIDLEKRVAWADLVITGEGKLDNQTKHGKVPSGVASIARQYEKPIVAFAGIADPGAQTELEGLFNGVESLCEREEDAAKAMSQTHEMLTDKAESFALHWGPVIDSRGE